MIATALVTFDVEEFDAPRDFGHPLTTAEEFTLGARSFEHTLDLLSAWSVPATLFVTASLAQYAPSLVRSAVTEGHELASHGWTHSIGSTEELHRARCTLEQLSGTPVLGYRPARFGAVESESVHQAGYRYLSSENPIWMPGRYNNLLRPRTVYRKGELWEVPLSATPLVRVPLFWLAAKRLPRRAFITAIEACLRCDGYAHFLWHPWEFLELSAHQLPRYASAPDGKELALYVESLLHWVRARARFELLTPWLQRTVGLCATPR